MNRASGTSRSALRRILCVIAACAALAGPIVPAFQGLQGSETGSGSVQPSSGDRCLACGKPCAEGQELAVIRGGQRIHLHLGPCAEEWQSDGDRLYARLLPRGALFDEPLQEPAPMQLGWFLGGLLVLSGLLFGGACSYLAVGKGLAPLPWFLAGLLLQVIALVLVLSKKSEDLARFPAGVPAGLGKVPSTHEPRACERCGFPNHPAAARCSGCQAELTPRAPSEVARS